MHFFSSKFHFSHGIENHVCVVFKGFSVILIWNYIHGSTHEGLLVWGELFGKILTTERTKTKPWTRRIKSPPRVSVCSIWFSYIKSKLKSNYIIPNFSSSAFSFHISNLFELVSCLQDIMKSLALEGSHNRYISRPFPFLSAGSRANAVYLLDESPWILIHSSQVYPSEGNWRIAAIIS